MFNVSKVNPMETGNCKVNSPSSHLIHGLLTASGGSSRFSSNSEAKASELLENLEEMCFPYYMHSAGTSTNLNLQSHSSVLPVVNTIYKSQKCFFIFFHF